jgi:PPK2 family polyphosphate:nucleotide phosphotransferase
MRLEPVKKSTKIRLRDSDARRPKDVPDEEALRDKTKKHVERIADLQRVLYADARYALLVVLQGRDASGKDGTIRRVFGGVNPQGCEVSSFGVPTPFEARHDFLWRIHQRVPARGLIGIFNRSHYEDVLVPRVHSLVPKRVWSARYDQINEFEELLAENRVVILKFFLHVSRDEQKRRLIDRLTDPEKNWKFRAGDLDDRALWSTYTSAYQDMLRRCSTRQAPWYIVPADDEKVRNWLIARTVADTLASLDLRYPPGDPKVLRIKVV